MFKSALSDHLKAIFDLKKVSFDHPGESKEQDCLFVEIQKAPATIKDGEQIFKVTAKATMFGTNEDLSYGFFAKQIKRAPKALVHNFFFYDIEDNSTQFQDVVERSLSFIYFFSGQYDPAMGTITSISTSEDES